jgi:hypothetical protein
MTADVKTKSKRKPPTDTEDDERFWWWEVRDEVCVASDSSCHVGDDMFEWADGYYWNLYPLSAATIHGPFATLDRADFEALEKIEARHGQAVERANRTYHAECRALKASNSKRSAVPR